MGQTLAHRVGADPKFGYDKEDEVVVFEPHAGKDWKVVNVDTTIKAGILRAKELGLVQSHTTDLIFTMEPNFAGRELYDEANKGRFLALFRHPVERAVSMFYYLQTATWERTYRPEWADMSVIEWAGLEHQEEDYMVHKLVGKKFGDPADETDLIIAKELVRQRFIVGLMGEMKESIRRFNIVLGVDDESERSQKCMIEFGLVIEPEEQDTTPAVAAPPSATTGDKEGVRRQLGATSSTNSNKHPKFEEGIPEYEAVASRNRLDMLLYKYIETLFDAQKEIVDSYLEPEATLVVQSKEGESTSRVVRQVEEKLSSPRLGAPREESSSKLETMKPHKPNGLTVPVSSAAAPGTVKQLVKSVSPEEKAKEAKSHEDVASHLTAVNDPVKGRDVETPFFWHVPKCGGTTLQRLYWCMGSTIANEVGVNPKFGIKHGELSDIVAFKPWEGNPGKVVNVDVTTNEGIIEAKNRGFLSPSTEQPKVDFISSSEFRMAAQMLFSTEHRGRAFALFRHPIDRAVSKFYYLQKATWEPTYNTKWATMSLEEFSSRDRGDANWMVRNLVGITGKGARALTDEDLELAKEIVRTKFIVGLMDSMPESVHRFNLLLGIDESDATNQQCMEQFSSNGGDARPNRNKDKIKVKNQFNSYAHPTAERGSEAWENLSKIHNYDVSLYGYIEDLFSKQAAMFPKWVEPEKSIATE